MSRRSIASLWAVGLLMALVIVAAQLPVPYVTVSPGRTVDVLGQETGEPAVHIEGRRTFPTTGQIRFTTVSITRPEADVSLVEALSAWARDDIAVVPREAMYPETSSDAEERTESAAQMVSSQDAAAAVALQALGYRLPSYVEVTAVTPDGASKGRLRTRDQIRSVNGVDIATAQDVLDAMDGVRPGEVVEVVVVRDGSTRTVDITTRAAEDNREQAVLGIFIGPAWRFPFEVRVDVPETIGGPSAGLMFALSIYDTLTPGSLTGGRVISGSAPIGPPGTVGPIGGIQQKIAGAEDSGARVFFVPEANCASAVQATPPEDMELVLARTFSSAVRSLETYADDPSADLPRCPR